MDAPISPRNWDRRSFLLAVAQLLGAAVPASARAPQAIGVNVYDLFMQFLWGRDTKGSPVKLEALAARGIPFVRFPASGQFAGHWTRWKTEPDRWWSEMDRVFAAAERTGVKLVPCVLWSAVSIAYHVGEPVQAWGDARSATRQLARDYTTSFVRRYRRSPAVLMWECTNELNVWADFPEAIRFWPKSDDTAPGREPRPSDLLSSAMVRDGYAEFARIVRALDPRAISAGTDLPRQNAWNLAHGGKSPLDTRAQFVANLREITPPDCTVTSVHLYATRTGSFYNTFANVGALLAGVCAAADADGRSSFLGEFGIPSSNDRAAERRDFLAMFTAIQASDIAYAALWDYDRTIPDPHWNITATNDRSYQLDLIANANRVQVNK